MKRVAAAFMLMLLLAGVALGDRLILKTGKTFTGKVTVKGTIVEIAGEFGRVEFNSSQVAQIIREKLPEDEYEEKAANLPPNDKSRHLELAEWCAAHNLREMERYHLLHALRITPEDEVLRKRLGFRLHEGRWMTETQIMEARGLVRFRNEWMKPEEKERIIAAEKEEARRKKQEADKARRKEKLDKKRLASLKRAFAAMKRDSEPVKEQAVDTNYLPPWYRNMYNNLNWKKKRTRR